MKRRRKPRQPDKYRADQPVAPDPVSHHAPTVARPASEQVRLVQYERSGPLPEAAELDRYNQVHPGLADRIVRMAEGEAIHRRNVEGFSIRLEGLARILGILGAILCVGMVCAAGAYAIKQGAPTAAAAIITATVVSLVVAFLKGHQSQPPGGPHTGADRAEAGRPSLGSLARGAKPPPQGR